MLATPISLSFKHSAPLFEIDFFVYNFPSSKKLKKNFGIIPLTKHAILLTK